MNTKIEKDNSDFLVYDLYTGIHALQNIVNQHTWHKIVIQLRLDMNASSETTIKNNLDYFKTLEKKGISLEFCYYYAGKPVSDKITLQQIIDDEIFLEQITDEIKTKFSSNLERTIAAYDIAKNIKKYLKESEEDKIGLSRCLYCYLNNDYLVCAGYANFFKNLLARLNIPCVSIPINFLNHFRNYIYLVDEKYGIDGFYSVDSCWEKLGEYKFFLETSIDGRQHMIYLLQSNGINYDKLYHEYDSCFFAENIEELRKNCKFIGKILYHLANSFYNNTEVRLYKKNDEQANKLLCFFKAKTNKKIPTNILIDAITRVKSKTFKNFEELEIKEDLHKRFDDTR